MSFHKTFDPKAWIPLVSYGILCTVLIIAAAVYLGYTLYLKPKITKNTKIQSIIALICFAIATLCHCGYIVFNKFPDSTGIPHINRVKALSLWSVYNVFFSSGYSLTYLLFYNRLIRSLDKSLLKTPATMNYTYYTLLSIYYLLQWVNSIIWTLHSVEILSWEEYNKYYWALLWTRLVLDVVISLIVLYLFTSKMYRFTVDRNVAKQRSAGQYDIGSQSSGTHKMFQAMVQQFLLSSVTILSTQMLNVSELTLSFSIDHAVATNTFELYEWAYFFNFFAQCTDAVISTFYIVLSFSGYWKICGFGHRSCVSLWEHALKKSIQMEMDAFERKEAEDSSSKTENEVSTC